MTEFKIAMEAHPSISARATAGSAVGSSDVRPLAHSNRAFADLLSEVAEGVTSAEQVTDRGARVLVCQAQWGAEVGADLPKAAGIPHSGNVQQTPAAEMQTQPAAGALRAHRQGGPQQ